MKWAIVATVWFSIAIAVVLGGIPMMIRSRIRRWHRVSPSVPSDAPTYWAFSPATPARLHRRLCRSVSAVREAVTATKPSRMARLGHRLSRRGAMPTLAPLLGALEAKALTVDHHLAELHNVPRARRLDARRLLAGQVHQLEDLARQLTLLAVEGPGPTPLTGVDRDNIARRIGAVGHEPPPIDTTGLPAPNAR